ncbi:MAG TPA: heparan-alpha-glucosaminide N-acetyltransferase domain-containing protein [Acidimicrobiales bacterium]|nr:heparan-alpha-glucosaminide N-acetyltransferase domain-containing protein [Acidimicrobiales bacterium]
MSPGRLRALDAGRGAAVALMVLVNNPGDPAATPRQLTHAPWHGLTFADVVFPAFVVMVGASAALGRPPWWRVARRVVVLIVLGLVVNAALAWPVEANALRWTGVLQRLAFVGLGVVVVARRRAPWVAAAVAALCLVAHWIVLTTVEGGMLEPAANAARTIDRTLLPVRHLYAGPTDPEGVLGTLSAIAMGVLGLLAARTLLRRDRWNALRALVFGMGLAALGLATSWWMPLNKRLWTPSFALLTGGVTISVLAVLVLVEATRGARALAPLEAFGRNAIVVYVGSEVLARTTHRLLWPVVGDALSGAGASVTYASLVTVLWLAVAAVMHWRRWYVTV